ncbi:terpene synthase metal binding domain protein [Aspergillus pseudodeflectus]|uniref:Terpene synthase n=1 Tax=Aspergillus pseudodeflectus TaxID=176178 RepID=A0ABR4KVM5_9EURO
MALAELQNIFYPGSAETSSGFKCLPPPIPGTVQEQSSENEEKEEEDDGLYTTVHLPKMFTLFLSGNPPVNPYYAEVRAESERWLARACNFDHRAARRLAKTDFSYFCSISAPRAGREELKTVCDWGNWVFPFDDMFDSGALKDNPTRAQEVIEDLLAGMGMGLESSKSSPQAECRADDPLIQVHNSVWERIVKASPIGTQRRFAQSMHDYCMGSLVQVQNASTQTYPSIEEMLGIRRRSSGVAPLFALVEYAHKLNIPDTVFETRSIQEIDRIGVDLVLIQNDILSYCREEVRLSLSVSSPLLQPSLPLTSLYQIQREGVSHNLVAIARRNGMSAQAAFTHVGDMLSSRYRDWYLALAELPSWGEDVDVQVQEYVEGVRSVVRANLGWSFRSQRYFGERASEVRKSGVVRVQRVL